MTDIEQTMNNVELGLKISESLMSFPFHPPLGTPDKEVGLFYECLQKCYALEITKILNEAEATNLLNEIEGE